MTPRPIDRDEALEQIVDELRKAILRKHGDAINALYALCQEELDRDGRISDDTMERVEDAWRMYLAEILGRKV